MSAATVLPPPTPSPAPSLPGDDVLYEVVDGVYVELPKMSALSGVVASDLALEMGIHVKRNQLGKIVTDVLFPTRPGKQRRPDVAFVSIERWPLNRPVPPADPWPVAPDLAVEVLSPTDIFEKVLEKVQEYLDVGVREVWVVSPLRRMVFVFPAQGNARILDVADSLDGGDILRGFRLPLEQLLPPVLESEDSAAAAPANAQATS